MSDLYADQVLRHLFSGSAVAQDAPPELPPAPQFLTAEELWERPEVAPAAEREVIVERIAALLASPEPEPRQVGLDWFSGYFGLPRTQIPDLARALGEILRALFPAPKSDDLWSEIMPEIVARRTPPKK